MKYSSLSRPNEENAMNAKKFWATLACVLIVSFTVLTVSLNQPAYAQSKTHLGVSPADMVILTSDNQAGSFYPFKRIFSNGDKIDFDAVPAGKVLIITDISICYAGTGVLGAFIFRLRDIINLESEDYNIVYEYTLTGLKGHKFAFTSGLTFYPLHKITWDFWGEIPNSAGLVRVYLYGYLIDAPPFRRPEILPGPPSP